MKESELLIMFMRSFRGFRILAEIQIWIQRIAFNLPHPVTYTENICKIVNGETGVNLWNNDWVDEPYKGAFPQYKICTEWVRDSYTPVIDIDEISLFNIY